MTGITLQAAVLLTLLRAALVAGMALPCSTVVCRWVAAARTSRARMLRICISVAPVIIPELLPGFHYRIAASAWAQQTGVPLQNTAALTELLYLLLQLVRSVAAAVLLRYLLPAGSRASTALHSWRLLRPRLATGVWLRGWWSLSLRTCWQPGLFLWCVLGLRVFQEFETAALMQIDRAPVAWTVWLFDASAAGLRQSELLRLTPYPLFPEILLLLLLLSWGRQAGQDGDEQSGEHRQRTASWSWAELVVLLSSGGLWVLYVLLPLLGSLLPGISGLLLLAESGGMVQRTLVQMGVSLGFAFAAAAGALALATRLLRERQQGFRRVLLWLILLPGLSGNLVVALLLQFSFQLPLLLELRDTFVPLLAGLVFSVLPGALVMVLLLRSMSSESAVHSAELLQQSSGLPRRRAASRLLWELSDGRWVMAWLLTAQWCFWNVTVSSILRPPAIELVVNRLYNEMHFARTESLLGLTLLATIAPALLAVLLLCILRIVRSIGSRRDPLAGGEHTGPLQ